VTDAIILAWKHDQVRYRNEYRVSVCLTLHSDENEKFSKHYDGKIPSTGRTALDFSGEELKFTGRSRYILET